MFGDQCCVLYIGYDTSTHTHTHTHRGKTEKGTDWKNRFLKNVFVCVCTRHAVDSNGVSTPITTQKLHSYHREDWTQNDSSSAALERQRIADTDTSSIWNAL